MNKLEQLFDTLVSVTALQIISLLAFVVMIIGTFFKHFNLASGALFVFFISITIYYFIWGFSRVLEFNNNIQTKGISSPKVKRYWTEFIVLISAAWLLLISFFTGLYFYFSTLGTTIQSADGSVTTNIGDIFYFSTVTITSLGYGDFHPVGVGRTIAIVEVFIGYLLLGLTIATMTMLLKGTFEFYSNKSEN